MAYFIIILLVLVNAFFVAAEFAVISVRKTKIRQISEQGNILATKLLPYLEDPHKLDDYISASQIGITLTSLVLGAYGQSQLSDILTPLFINYGGVGKVAAESSSALIILLLLTAFQMIIAELVPKAIALEYSTEVSLYTVIPMSWSLILFKKSIHFLNGTSNFILNIFDIEPSGHKHIHSPEEIEIIISESATGGAIEADDHSRLYNALQLKLRTVKQLIVPRIHMFAIDISTPIEELINTASKSPYNHIPIYSENIDNIVGIIHTKQMTKYFVEKGEINSIQEILIPVLLVPESLKADKMLDLFSKKVSQQAIVVDEFGGTVGLITLEDVLAEFMGEVGDEFKNDIAKIETFDNGVMRIPGIMRIDEVEFLTGINLKCKSETIGGFVSETLGRLAEQGEKIDIEEAEIEVEKIGKRSVSSVLIKRKDKVLDV
jgi:putative hemolysin